MYVCEFVNGNTKIKLVASALTLLKYKALIGRDLINDIEESKHILLSSMKELEKFGNLSTLQNEGEFKKLSRQEQKEFSELIGLMRSNDNFMLDVIVSLVATAEHPVLRSYHSIANEIPKKWIEGDSGEYQTIIEMINSFIPKQQQTVKDSTQVKYTADFTTQLIHSMAKMGFQDWILHYPLETVMALVDFGVEVAEKNKGFDNSDGEKPMSLEEASKGKKRG